MKAAVLYSGGKDSSLMAVILQLLGYHVEVITANFDVFPSWKPAKESADNLGFKHQILKANPEIMDEAAEIILKDGFPNQGIKHLHHKVLYMAAQNYNLVADGTRRDDRVPKIKLNQIQSLEDTERIQYVNLAGWGHRTINQLSKKLFKIKKEPTSMKNNSDYEIEIRYLIGHKKGENMASKLFPPHTQTRVIGWREDE
ncbi:MAG: DUF7411 family protein [Methanobacteriaceae archaeon]